MSNQITTDGAIKLLVHEASPPREMQDRVLNRILDKPARDIMAVFRQTDAIFKKAFAVCANF
ncbi:MAG: hypothetical protein QM689_08520 [Oscillospiraceae bacterium]